MTRWDEIAAGFDHVRLSSFCNGRIKIGYPHAVGQVDINLTGSVLLSDRHIIGQAEFDNCGMRSFALPGISPDLIHEVPGGRHLLCEGWLIDLSDGTEIAKQPVSYVRGMISGNDRLFSYWTHEIACYDASGLSWFQRGLFGGNMHSVELEEDVLVCSGHFDWDHNHYRLDLSSETGEVIGGDAFAVKQHEGIEAPR